MDPSERVLSAPPPVMSSPVQTTSGYIGATPSTMSSQRQPSLSGTTTPPMAFYALSAPSTIHVFFGFTEAHGVARCQAIGAEAPTPLPENEQHSVWNHGSSIVQFFISADASQTTVLDLLPEEENFTSKSKILFTLVELPNGRRFAEEWLRESREDLFTLSQDVQCYIEVENATHLIRIGHLEESPIHVDVVCSPEDVGALYRMTAITEDQPLALSINMVTSRNSQHQLRQLTPLAIPIQAFGHLHGVLPNVHNLSLTMALDCALQIVLGACTFATQSLTLDLPWLGPHRDSILEKLAGSLMVNCSQSMKALRIHARALHHPSEQQASWSSISAFRSLPSLEIFSFEHPLPLYMNAHQVQSLLQSWTRARSISLSPRASIPQHRAKLADMSVLLAVRHFAPPSLRHFGITVDPNTSPMNGHLGSSIRGSCCLESLDIGVCLVADERELQVIPLIVQTLFPNLHTFIRG